MRRIVIILGLMSLVSLHVIADTVDPVQECLDKIQKDKYSKPKPGSPVLAPIGSKPLAQPDRNLPLTCLDGNLENLKKALANQISNCRSKTPTELDVPFQFGCKMVTKREYCLDASTQLMNLASTPGMTYATFAKRVAQDFEWFKSDGRAKDKSDQSGTPPKIPIGKTQFTGYFSPNGMEASAIPTAHFQYPVYSAPAGLTYIENPDTVRGCGINSVTGEPIHWCIQHPNGTFSALPTREEAHNGALKGLEIIYFKSLFDVQSLMLEGAGSVNVKQANGTVQKLVLNYAGMNGRPNNLLGNVVKCQGKKISGSWKSYYDARPREAFTDTVHYNPSIVFYKSGTDFMGTDNIPVTGGASLATDIKNSIPLGTFTLINVPPAVPKGPSKCKTFSSLALSQDTGGAIRYAHIDIYRGEGATAENEANNTNFPGDVYLAIPKGAGRAIPNCK